METKMQKLEKRNTYTPTNTSLVCSSVAVSLNREETLSEHSLKTFSNNLEENRLSRRGQNLGVSVDYLYLEGRNPFYLIQNMEVKSYGKGFVLSTRQFLTTLKDSVSLAQTIG